ncbi:MAG: ankyrin repeat domain-containing protein, partial [Candidatus Dadabacteria bacterium]|nr:ankyrin repeat domain-containing protein [Candidatus Dadabacteria bacterium]
LMLAAARWSWGFEELLKALPGSEPGSSVWGDEAIRELLKAGAEVNARADNGYTALMWAAVKGGKRAIRELLKAGADIEARNNEGRTVLMEAAHGGNTKAIIELLKAGADIEARDNEGKTAFDVWQWEGGEWETEGYQIISDLLRP